MAYGRLPGRPFCADARSRSDHRQLDLASAQAAYKTWRQRALGYLYRDSDGCVRGDVRLLAICLEKQPEEATATTDEAGAAAVGLFELALPVSDALYLSIIGMVVGAVAQQSDRFCVELWRRLPHRAARGVSRR